MPEEVTLDPFKDNPTKLPMMGKRTASQRTPSKEPTTPLKQSIAIQTTASRVSSAVRRLNGTTPPQKLAPQKQSKVSRGSRGLTASSKQGRKTLYERSKLHLAAKEQKVKQLETKLNRELTFRPETNRGRTKNHAEVNVFDRLYQLSKNKRSVSSAPSTRGRTSSKVSSRSTPSSITSSRSGNSSTTAFERLYQEGLRRSRTKSLTDRVERERRIKRQQARELEACTFQPRMDWKKGKNVGELEEVMEFLPPPPPPPITVPHEDEAQRGEIIARHVSVCQSANDVEECNSHVTPVPEPTTVSCDDTLLSTACGNPPIQVIHARVLTTTPRQSPYCRYAVSPLRDPDCYSPNFDGGSNFDGVTEYGSI